MGTFQTALASGNTPTPTTFTTTEIALQKMPRIGMSPCLCDGTTRDVFRLSKDEKRLKRSIKQVNFNKPFITVGQFIHSRPSFIPAAPRFSSLFLFVLYSS